MVKVQCETFLIEDRTLTQGVVLYEMQDIIFGKGIPCTLNFLSGIKLDIFLVIKASSADYRLVSRFIRNTPNRLRLYLFVGFWRKL
jgi:hypothetical protein